MEPKYEVKRSSSPPMPGWYFVLIDSHGVERYESNVYDDEDLCAQGAAEELANQVDSGKIS